MSHKNNGDLRNTGDGGWSYFEHELFSLFVPLIGSDGGMVYMALCRLVPLAAVNPDLPVTTRRIEESSCVSRSTVNRKMQEIVRLGMVEETRYARNRPSTYKLVSLRRLAEVGRAELVRRLGVPPGDTGTGVAMATADTGIPIAASQQLVEREEAASSPIDPADSFQAAPAVPTGAGVPRWDTEPIPTARQVYHRAPREIHHLVSHETASVSQKQASVSQNEGLLIRRKRRRQRQVLNPLTPATARGDVPGEKPSGDLDQAARITMQFAIGKVMRECNLSEPRLRRVVERAMRTEAAKSDEPPDWNAIGERMIAGQREYTAAGRDGLLFKPENMRRFFGDGLWCDDGRWGIDKIEIRERRNGRRL